MLLSIIIPTLNSKKYLSEALEIISAQTFRDFECVLVDGGSSDSTLSIAESYKGRIANLKIISGPDQGIYDAMNKGLELARGEWVYFQGSDDRLLNPHVLANVAKFIEQTNGVEFVYGNVIWGKTNQIYHGEVSYRKLLDFNICHQAVFAKKALLQKFNGFDLQFKSHADWDLNVRIYQAKDVKRAYMNQVISYYGTGGFSSLNDDEKFKEVRLRLKERLMQADPGYEEVLPPPLNLPAPSLKERVTRKIQRLVFR